MPARHSAFIETSDGTRLHWRAWGRGAPVLFVHSWAMRTEMWDYQFAALAERGCRCIGYDRRGHGRSDIPAEGYDYDTLADDLAAVIAALDLRGVTLVGHSMGACEIVRYLTRHGSARVKRIALLAPTAPLLLQTKDNPAGFPAAALEAMRAEWRRDFPKWVADNTAPFFVPETSPEIIKWGIDMLLEIPLPVAIACNRTVAGSDLREDLRRIAVPTLLLHGDKDVSAPLELTGRPTAALIANCTFKLYEGAPHGLMYTHMERVNADLAAFAAG